MCWDVGEMQESFLKSILEKRGMALEHVMHVQICIFHGEG